MNKIMEFMKGLKNTLVPFLAVVVMVGSIIIVFRANRPTAPTEGRVSLTGKNIIATLDDVAIRRSNRGTVELSKVNGEIVLEKDFKKGESIPVSLDLSSIKSNPSSGKHKVTVSYINATILPGYQYELLHLWDLSLNLGISQEGLLGSIGYAFTEHSEPLLGYTSTGKVFLGYSWRF